MIGYPVMRSVFLLLVSFCVALSTAQSPQPFRVQSSSEQLRNALVVPTSGGDTVYVGSSTSLYSLNQTLSLQAVFTPLSSFNAMLLDVEQADKLLACQSDRCLLLNATSLQNNQSVGNPTPARLLLVSGEDNEVVLISSDSSGAMFFVGKATAPNGGDPFVSTISKFSLTLAGSPAISTVAHLDENSIFFARSFFTSFHKNGFVYFVFSIVIQQERQIRIARICSNDGGTSDGNLGTYSEVLLNCVDNGGPPLSGTYYAATIHDEEDDARMLLALHQAPQSISYICSYNLSAIDAAMEDTLTKCTNGIGTRNLIRRGSTIPCPTNLKEEQKRLVSSCNRFTQSQFSHPIEVATPFSGSVAVSLGNSQPFHSLLLTTVSGSTFIYAGSNGKLEQFHLNQTSSSARYIRNVTLNSLRNVTELHSSSNGEFVYALTSNELFRHPVDVCSDEHTCSDCLMSRDPICGWCSLSNSCSRQMNCPSGPWLQGEVSRCPTIQRVEPSVVYVNQLSQGGISLSLSVSNIPQGTQYQCVFAFDGSVAPRATTATVINSTQIMCVSPTVEELPVFSLGQDTHFVSLSLRTNDNQVDVVTAAGETFGFTNCSVLTSCFMCLQGRQQCQWCPSETTCNPPQEACTNSLQGQPESSCSFIEGSDGSTSNYLVHTSVNQTLSVRARNLDLFSSMPLQCKLTSQDGIINITVPAVWKSQASQVECQSRSFEHQLNGTVPTISLELEVQVLSSMILPIENPNNIRVILYSCSSLGLDCGQCLSIESDYQCGYCVARRQCLLRSHCTSNDFLTNTDQVTRCDRPVITSFTPTKGPIRGGTTITIKGTNLGAERSDVDSVWIREVVCNINNYTAGREIRCTTEESTAAVFGAVIQVNFTYDNVQAISLTQYNFDVLALDSNPARPSRGPRSGGTLVTITGQNLGIGNRRRVTLNGQLCMIQNVEDINVDSANITCITMPFTSSISGGQNIMGLVTVVIDDDSVSRVGFNYVEDPTITGISPNIGFVGGGTNVTVTGTRLDIVQEPQILAYVSDTSSSQPSKRSTTTTNPMYLAGPCTAVSNTQMHCSVPKFNMSNMSLSADMMRSIGVGFRMDGVTGLLQLTNLSLVYYGNPLFDSLRNNNPVLSPGSITNITIVGTGFVFTADQVKVEVGVGICENIIVADNQDSSDDELTCTLTIDNDASTGTYGVTVVLGNIREEVGNVEVRPPIDPLVIIIPVFAFVVIVGLSLFIVVVTTLCHKYKKKDEQSDRLLLELERLESSVAHECKQGFAELQTDLDEITGDLAGCRLPYHNFRLYIVRSLFPGQKDHSVLHNLQFPAHKRLQMERGLRDFVGLLHDKTVLITIIHSLERQRQQFTIRDKSAVGSLLLIALHDRLDYATEILKSLLTDLVRRTVNEAHPKLLLRRTESVAEKMLSSWLVFTLHEYVTDHVGQPLYLLYKAVKSQLEKGPIDVITGEARYSLSEQKLIRQQIDVNVINATIATEDSSEISVKLLDCDSISQAKEKVLDALYKASPVSLRPSLTTVDLGWRRTDDKEWHILRDDDGGNFSENGWRMINTLKRYHVPDHAVFRLIKRRDHPAPGRVFDYVGNLAVSPGTRSRALSEADDGTRVWHLFKQVEEDPRSSPYTNHSKKMVTEIYLPRMLSTKTILQKFVDDLFTSMFSVTHPPSSPMSAFPSYPLMSPSQAVLRYTPGADSLPTSIKYLFDFLDDEAINAKIGDQDVVHMWKNNSIPLRFWVNLIKNPEFIFDINKSAVVDASLSVIAQAIIDGCSTSETRPTINSPTSKLLYSKEVQGYKASVKQFYADVQAAPRISEDYMMQYLRELSAHQTKLFHHSGGFHPECAQYEILRYTMKYKTVILEDLRLAGLEAKAQVFESVLRNVE